MMKHRNKRFDESAESSPEPNRYSYVRWIALAVAVLYFLPTLGIVSKSAFWAFSVNTYLPTELMIVHLTLVVMLFVFIFKPNLLRFVHEISPKVYYATFACALIFMALFLREVVPFYGDGYFFQRDIITNLPIKYAEVLTMLIYRAIYLVLSESSKSGATAYHFVNTICIVPAVIVLLYIARRSMPEYLPFVIFTFLGFGANVLFFGHVENYTLVYIVMLMYLYVITMQCPNIPILAFLLGISICLHLVALCLVPSFLYILWKIRAKDPLWRISLTSLGFFVLPFIITILFSFVAGITPEQLCIEIAASITTISEHTGQQYIESIFSINHWLDVINLLFLGLPTFLLITALIFTRRERKSFWYDQTLQLLIVLGLPFVLFVMFFNTPLGLPRDWDLGVTALVWIIAAVSYLAIHIAPKKRIQPSFLTSIGLLAFLLSLPWFILHHFPQLNVKRFNDILNARTELSGTAYGYEILGRYYHDTEDYRNSVKSYEKATEYDPQNWRRYYSIAMEYLNLRELRPAGANLRKAYELKPHETMILSELGMFYHNMGQNDSALVMFERVYTADSTDLANRHNLGCAYFWAGQYDSAHKVFNGILRSHPDQYNAMLGLVDVLIVTQNFAEAESLIKRIEYRQGRGELTQRYRKMLREAQEHIK